MIPWNIIKFIYNDFKTDVQFIIKVIKRVKSEEPALTWEERQRLKNGWNKSWKSEIKIAWIWILIGILAFIVGYNTATIHLQNECNEFIIETYVEPNRELFEMNHNLSIGKIQVPDFKTETT